MIEVLEDATEKGSIARRILEALPESFGIPEAREHYIAATQSLLMLIARAGGKDAVGFLSIKEHTPKSAEAFVLGVLPEWHRCGIGRTLFAEAERSLAAKGIRFLTVKTLGPTHPDPYYARTRRFYEAIGFEALEVLDGYWGDNPCLLMIKVLSGSETPSSRM